MKKSIFILLPLFCLLLSCNSNQEKMDSSSTDSIEAPSIAKGTVAPTVEAPTPQKAEVIELSKEFPKNYIDAGLPVWNKAIIDRANKIQNGDEVRYQFVLSSSEDVHVIAEHYENAMKKAGWTPNKIAAEAQKKNRRVMIFKKGDNQLMINVIDIPKKENRIITMMFPENVK